MSKHDDAELILKLYDLRREATMREARNWMFTFNPTSVQDVIDVLLGELLGQDQLEELLVLRFGGRMKRRARPRRTCRCTRRCRP